MQVTLILLVIGAAILFAQAQDYDNYRPPSCGRCDYRDFKGKQGPPGPKVYSSVTNYCAIILNISYV